VDDQHDVIIIGAGATGLAAARHLCDAGADTVVLESSDRVGGRIATELIDGYRIDRGFQVVNTAYPALRRLVDLAELDLRLFDHAVVLADGTHRYQIADPRRHPSRLTDSLCTPVAVSELLRLARFSVRVGYGSARALLAEPETDAGSYLAAVLDEQTIRRLVVPFLTGVFGAEPLRTSSRVLTMIWRSFVRGRIGVPAAGMARLAELLAAPLPSGCVRLNTRVTGISGHRVRTEVGGFRAAAIVVATDPSNAAALLSRLTAPPQRALTTVYHSTDTAPSARPVLLLDASGRTGIANSVVLTNAAPQYAPVGRHLVATTLAHGQPVDERALRRALGHLYGVDTSSWQQVTTVHPTPGLSAALPPRRHLRDPVMVGDDAFLAGDYRDSPSIQGALASGHRAARAVCADLDLSPGFTHS
jgi:phytoene dehydrogenase-like protein